MRFLADESCDFSVVLALRPVHRLCQKKSTVEEMFLNRYSLYMRRVTDEDRVKTGALRHKHVQVNQAKLKRACRVLGARTEREALDRALDLVVAEARINAALKKAGGKTRLRPVFR